MCVIRRSAQVASLKRRPTQEDLGTWRRAEDNEETVYSRVCRGRHESFHIRVGKLYTD